MSGFVMPGSLVVLGLGASGEAVAEWALDRAVAGEDVRVTVVDSGRAEALERRAARLVARGATVVLGSDEVPSADLVVASPGIPPHSALMRSAHALGVPVISEIELAYRVSRAAWVAVTGTNGKTTTTALIAHVLREAGFAAEPCGNFGPPAIRVAAEAGAAGIIVAEVSSFQLSLVDEFHPRVAVLLNITPDHLDYHGTMEAYTGDKARIFARQTASDVAVIDIDDPGSAALVDPVEALGVPVTRVSRSVCAARCACVDEGMLVIDDGVTRSPLLSVGDLPIRGEHNVSNALAAAAAAAAVGAGHGAIARGLGGFTPIAHRLEPVGVVGGVEYFNDSKATNPDAVLKALTAFADRPVVLLLGGRNKGVDLRPLASVVAARAREVVVFGEAADELEVAFEGTGRGVLRATGLEEAVFRAAEAAELGDAVVLSPGCTSFDEFSDYTQRGDRFKALVAHLGRAEER